MITQPIGLLRPQLTGNVAQLEFQTNKSGVFSPSFTIDVGEFEWDFGDGSPTYIGNSPSHIYADGTTKTVTINTNTVTASSIISNINFASENIVGELNFSDLPTNITGEFFAYSNALLTDIKFSDSGNTCNNFRVYSCNLTGALDLSGFTLSSQIFIRLNPLLTNIIFSSSGNTISTYLDVNRNGFSGTLDLSSFTFLPGSRIYTWGNSLLTGITFSSSGNYCLDLKLYNCDLTSTLDLSSFTFSGSFNLYNNSNLTDITFSGSGNTSTDFRIYSNDLTGTIDLSSFTFATTSLYFYSNSNLTGVTFSGSGNTCSYMIGRFCNLTGVLDISGFTNTGGFEFQGNSSMTGITWGIIGQFGLFRVDANAFTQSEIDEILNIIQVYSTANAPTANLTLNLTGGTNSAPSASGLADKSTIETNYTNASFTATITNN